MTRWWSNNWIPTGATPTGARRIPLRLGEIHHSQSAGRNSLVVRLVTGQVSRARSRPLGPVNGRRASLLGLVVAVMLLAAVASISLADPALAKKASSAPSTLTLKANFKRFGPGGVLGNDDRVFTFHRSTGTGVLVDGSTGRRTTVASRGCFLVDAIGGSSIAFSCGSGADVSYELNDMNSGQFRPLTVPSPIAGGCAPYTSACASLDAVGSYWAEFVGGCPTEHCGPSDVVFENFLTSATPADPSSRTVVPDLDARTLSRKLCKPVTVPTRTLPNSPPGFGSVVSDGRFQIATGDGGSYLEECGARLHRPCRPTSIQARPPRSSTDKTFTRWRSPRTPSTSGSAWES
jgi:hypothetical protein